VLALGVIGEDAVLKIASALKDSEEEVRLNAVAALQQLGVKSKLAVPDLIGVLKDKNEDVRRRAIVTLRILGPEAKEAIAALTAVAKEDAVENLRAEAKDALEAISPK
jgi:HEAT repeat protein